MNDAVLTFTEGVSELLNAGMDLPRSLSVLDGEIASEMRARVSEGERFSLALMSCRAAVFPDWYVAFVSASESGGNLPRTMEHLARTLSETRAAREKFLGAASYPLLIVVLTAVCAFVSVFSYSSVFQSGCLFGMDGAAFKAEAVRSCLVGGAFLALVALAVVFVLRGCLGVDPCVSLFKSLSFLCDCGLSVVAALDCSACVVERSPRLCAAVAAVRSALMGGGDVSGAFRQALYDAGFVYESRVAYSSLSLSESGGGNCAFSKIAEAVEKRRAKFRSAVLSFEQPVLLCAAAVYLAIVMKSVVVAVF